ncbi:MAG TPA: glycosyltransferase [Usitatibacter sp.]
MKLLYHGPLWHGSTSLQRANAFGRLPGVTVVQSDTGDRLTDKPGIIQRVRWKLGWPADTSDENGRLLALTRESRPGIVFVDNSKFITVATLHAMRAAGAGRLVYYTPDNILASHVITVPIRRSFPEWDTFFTTKTFNVEPLARARVRKPLLVGKSFDPGLHFPMRREEVGPEFEQFDVVFAGSFESERCASINALARSGLSVVVHSGNHDRWRRWPLDASVVLRGDVYGEEYRRAWHHGKLALGFLRKISKDRITQRSMEIAAMGRPMLAERTDEHDSHFRLDEEYIGFTSDDELVEKAREWLGRDAARIALGAAARRRCETSGYSTLDRAKWMLDQVIG